MTARGWLLWGTGGGVAGLVAFAFWAIPLDLSNERVQQAAIAGIVIAAGWFMGFLLREVGQHMGRIERLRDVHRALYAEIQHNLDNLGSPGDLIVYRDEMLARMAEGDGFVPFIPRERNDMVFRAILPEIQLLPQVSIDPIVGYYSQLAALETLIEDMRGESFKTMAPSRRAAIYTDYIALKTQAVAYGRHALTMIDAFARGGRHAARQMDATVVRGMGR